ncbi:hypothetical protein PHM1_229 [Eurybiavirus PHM1]|uniref:Uncharacterized protein n=1 Tax=Prochlorococcus phage P-HM1 TaxID=445700 RepID=E3SN60_9CAUD|nr:hypothetical protein PHM1_229 [Prochlorococcus phage P-HM1]ADO98853.1 hypothetical protein PHM1_229 [Prochlorococcus phage P-HM1]
MLKLVLSIHSRSHISRLIQRVFDTLFFYAILYGKMTFESPESRKKNLGYFFLNRFFTIL